MSTPQILDVIADPKLLTIAADALRSGEVVAFPTETVYGLGAHALDEDAVRKIFEIKGRPPTNPLIVHVASVEAARELVREWPPEADALAEAFWPGPLTMILPRNPAIPDIVTAGLDSVGIRVPSHSVAQRLLELAGVPVAAPSANPYMGVSPTCAQHVSQGLPGLKYIVDAGPCSVGLESTVISLVGAPRILRPGMVTLSMIRRILPTVEVADDSVAEGQAAMSPGLAQKHYSPKARVMIAPPSARAMLKGNRVGVILRKSATPTETILDALAITLPNDAQGYARGLYAALHDLDSQGCETIIIEPPPHDDEWTAVWNRIKRAAD